MVNKVILTGNVVADPEHKKMPNGKPVANIRFATNERWRDADGNTQQRAEYHRVVVFNEGLCKLVDQYVRKGSRLYIEGQIKTREWTDKNDAKRYATEIILQGYNCVIELNGEAGGNRNNSSGGGNNNTGRAQASQSRGRDDLGEDIPFSPETR